MINDPDQSLKASTIHSFFLVQASPSDAHMSSKKPLLSIRADPSELADQNYPIPRTYS